MLGLALTQKYDLVKKCLYELIKYNKDVSVKCRLGLGMDEDKSYIFDYLKLFNEIGIKKVFIHQANMKMDEAIVKRLYKLYDKEIPENILPMNIQSLGNSSVATIPTLFDQVLKNKIINHKLNQNDIIVFASVGAGMNVNSMVYKI